MTLLNFTFKNMLTNEEYTVKGSNMRNAMYGAAMKLKCKDVNLQFICVKGIN